MRTILIKWKMGKWRTKTRYVPRPVEKSPNHVHERSNTCSNSARRLLLSSATKNKKRPRTPRRWKRGERGGEKKGEERPVLRVRFRLAKREKRRTSYSRRGYDPHIRARVRIHAGRSRQYARLPFFIRAATNVKIGRACACA